MFRKRGAGGAGGSLQQGVASLRQQPVGRFLVPGHPLSLPGSYEAGAHIWVGVLIAMSVLCWDRELGKLATGGRME